MCERLGQPAVIGEILAGVIIGPSLLNWVQPTEITGALAEIGVAFCCSPSAWKPTPRIV